MNLINDIRSDLVNESASLANTLRKAKILASEIGLPEFRQWVESELNGYPERDSVPEYRRFQATNLGTLSGSFGRMDKNVVVPTFNLPEYVKDIAENLIFVEGVGELEAQAPRAPLYRKWPQEFLFAARQVTGWSGGMELVDVQQPIPAHTILGVLDQVKNRLLSFILELQVHDITSESMKNQTVNPETVKQIFHFTISGNQNIIAAGENVHQTTTTVQKDNIESLLNLLHELNLDQDDINELKNILASEPTPTNGRLGPKVRNWLGGIMEKVASGALSASTSTLLTQAINAYYGINQPN